MSRRKELIQRHHLRLCSRPEPEHREIYDPLGLSHEPLPQKHLAAKKVGTIDETGTCKNK